RGQRLPWRPPSGRRSGDDIRHKLGGEPADVVLGAQLVALQAHDADILSAIGFELLDQIVEFAVMRSKRLEALQHLVGVDRIETVVAQALAPCRVPAPALPLSADPMHGRMHCEGGIREPQGATASLPAAQAVYQIRTRAGSSDALRARGRRSDEFLHFFHKGKSWPPFKT